MFSRTIISRSVGRTASDDMLYLLKSLSNSWDSVREVKQLAKVGCPPIVKEVIKHEIGIKSQDLSCQDSEHSTVTYTSVSFPVEDDSDIGSPGIDGPPMMPEDPYAYIMAAYEVPPSPDYIPGPEVPPSPDYIPGPEEPQSPPPLDFVPEPMYPEYMPQEDEILPAEEQPLPATAASPTADSPGYVPESDLEEEPEEDDEDPEEDPADYPADGDDDDDEDRGRG
ncbi:hypothetical protein Tco_0653340 [Tanacetum coccineum]|uniref:Uncharacterized protein n=1 Tax=Tanacetum coccineum TaxID=301880 RepID=A0ABQ4X036_9ASTR